MRWARSILCAVLCGLCLSALLPHSAALAATPQEKARARELYGKGQQLFREGSYQEAERAFEEAYRVVPNAVVLLSIAECQTRTEQYQRAIDSLEAYLREKPDAKDRAEVSSQIETLRAKPATLTVQSDVPGASILVDETDSNRATPAELSLSPGHHVIGLLKDGYQHAEQGVDLTPGERETLQLTLVPTPPPQPQPAPAPAPVAEPTRGPRHTTPAFWVATGIGAAGLVTGITLGALALKREKEFDDNPTEKTADQGERFALFADIGYGVAAAGAVTALVVYLTSGKKSQPADQEAWSVAPALARGGAGVAASTKF
jgi:tetratricopeptide (TPR) repeat protein